MFIILIIYGNKHYIDQNTTLVTFIPFKSPRAYSSTQNYTLKYQLCQFCRGESFKDDNINYSNRYKFEWRPLSVLLDGEYKSIFSADEVNSISSKYTYKAYPYEEPFKPIDPYYIKISQKKNTVYRVQSDTTKKVEYNEDEEDEEELTSLMWDNRNTSEEFKVKFQINSKNTYNTHHYGRYVYGLRASQEVLGEDINWPESYKYQKISCNSEVLVDDYGYPFYSLELLKTYGIGFILSDWLIFEDGIYKVKFNPSYLQYWYDDSDAIGDINVESADDLVDDKIYSLKYIYDYLEIPSDEKIITDHYDLVKTKAKNNASKQEGLVDIWLIDNTETKFNPIILSELMFSRTYIGTHLKTLDEHDDCINVYPSKEGNTVTFVTYHWNDWYDILNNNLNNKLNNLDGGFLLNNSINGIKEGIKLKHNKAQTIFTRYSIDLSDLVNTEILGPEYSIITSWANTKDIKNVLLYPDPVLINSINPNEYALNGIDTSYKDNYYFTYYVENGNYVLLEEKYIYYLPLLTDIIKNTDPEYYQINSNRLRKGNAIKTELKYSEIGPGKIYTDEDFETLFESNKNYYMTPMEYYGNQQQEILGEDEININGSNNEIKWFWLNTLKNWCRYEDKYNQLILTCWNGHNGWDDLRDIVALCTNNELTSLMNKYLYTSKFFQLGAYYGLNGNPTFAPIRYANGALGQMSYMSLILNRETKSKNYNNFMQSLHRSKTYMNGESNDYANYFVHEEPDDYTLVYNDEPIVYDEKRKATFGVSTQYCPTVLKLANGNLAIMFIFKASTNGIIYNNLITCDAANNACIELFGDGSDKTMNDWKHYNSINTTEESTSEITTGDNETLYNVPTLTLIENDDKINNITLTTNRPNPTTQGYNEGDFLERWDR